jgi:hypothetical protein
VKKTAVIAVVNSGEIIAVRHIVAAVIMADGTGVSVETLDGQKRLLRTKAFSESAELLAEISSAIASLEH